MVNFNNESTVSTPAIDIIKILVLEKRTNVIEILEGINKREARDGFDNHILKARIQSLYWELQGMLSRRAETKEHGEEIKKLNHILFEKKDVSYNDLLEGFNILNLYLDEIHLTRIDTRQRYDRTKVENENSTHHI